MMLIAYGVLFDLEHGHSTNPWRERAVAIIIVSQIVASIIIVGKLKGIRVTASCFVLFHFCLSAVAGLEATMAVTNRWL
jgi:hypothetical protein